jgi:hypothetical protein
MDHHFQEREREREQRRVGKNSRSSISDESSETASDFDYCPTLTKNERNIGSNKTGIGRGQRVYPYY